METQLTSLQPAVSFMPLSKLCTKCKAVKPMACFAIHAQGRFKKQSRCRDCISEIAHKRMMTAEGRAMRQKSRVLWEAANKQKIRAYKVKSYLESRAKHLCWEASRRAKRKKVPFDLSTDDVAVIQRRIDEGHCELTGLSFEMEKRGAFNAPSLDRINPKLGYTITNIRVICRALNAALGEWGTDVFQILVAAWAKKFSCAPPAMRSRSKRRDSSSGPSAE
jgi:hypothetical protein